MRAGKLLAASTLGALALWLAGCQTAQPASDQRNDQPTAVTAPEKSIAPLAQSAISPNPASAASSAPAPTPQDALTYLKYSLQKCSTLSAYQLLFVRQERRGLLGLLQSAEHIETWFRREPFSVRMKWLDPGIKYGESTYVAGRDENRVLFVPRDTPLNLPQRIYRVSVNTPVQWGECRYPVTEFGLETLLKRTLETIAADPGARLSYVGSKNPPGAERPAECIRIDYSADTHPAPVQNLYFDPVTHLPVLTEMLFSDGRIDTAYAYLNLKPSVSLDDDDFVLEYERARNAQTTAGSNP